MIPHSNHRHENGRDFTHHWPVHEAALKSVTVRQETLMLFHPLMLTLPKSTLSFWKSLAGESKVGKRRNVIQNISKISLHWIFSKFQLLPKVPDPQTAIAREICKHNYGLNHWKRVVSRDSCLCSPYKDFLKIHSLGRCSQINPSVSNCCRGDWLW